MIFVVIKNKLNSLKDINKKQDINLTIIFFVFFTRLI